MTRDDPGDSAETRRTAQSLILIWRELPSLVGVRWPELWPRVEPLMRRIACESEPRQRSLAVADLLLALAPFPAVLARVAEVREVLDLPPGTRGKGLIQPTPLPAWSEIAGGLDFCLEPPTVERYTDITAPERLPRGKRGAVTVCLTAEKVADCTVSDPLVVRLDQVLQVWLQAGSPHLRVFEPRFQELRIPAAGDSATLVFLVKGERLGPETLRLDFRQEGRLLSSVPLAIEIVGAAGEESAATVAPAPLELGGPYVPPPDLELVVTTQESKKRAGTWFGFLLHSPSRALPHHFHWQPKRFVHGSLAALRAQLVDELDRVGRGKSGARYAQALAPEEAGRHLAALGERLFDELMPPALQRDLAAAMASSARTLQVTTDEPWIPWELLKPRLDKAEVETFLCERFRLARWLSGSLSQPSELVVRRLACVEAGKAGDRPLEGPARDRAVLAVLAHEAGLDDASVGDAAFGDVAKLLDEGAVGLWHFAAHGSRHLEEAAPGVIHLLRRTVLKPEHLNRERQQKIAASRPLVFLNVCSAAQQGVSLAGLGGWVNAWVEKCGAGLFIAPLCTVDDGLAHHFAATFYTALRRGETVGEAVREARAATKSQRPEDPTWLAYSVYGHPNARVRFEAHTPGLSRAAD